MLVWITVLLAVGVVSEYAIFKSLNSHLRKQRDEAERRATAIDGALQVQLRNNLYSNQMLDEYEVRHVDDVATIKNLEAAVRRHIEDEIRTSTAVALRISDLLNQIEESNMRYAQRALEGVVSDERHYE